MLRGRYITECTFSIPLGADKTGHSESEVHFNNFFQQDYFDTSILHGPTLGSDQCSHFLWHQGVKSGVVGRGEGTPVELVIFAYTCLFHHNF